jgi:hypothetical protein
VWFGPIISPVHTNDLALTRNEGLLLAVLFKTLLGQVCGLDAASTAPPKFLAERGFSETSEVTKLIGYARASAKLSARR